MTPPVRSWGSRALRSPLLLIPVLLAADQATKHWVARALAPQEVVPILRGFANLTYIRNTGAAFGLFANASGGFRSVFFLLVSVVALGLIGYLYWSLEEGERLLSVALSLVIGGALGNFIDRARFGSVVDFLDLHVGPYHWPAFNVADSAITVGAVALFLAMSFGRPRGKDPAGPDPAERE